MTLLVSLLMTGLIIACGAYFHSRRQQSLLKNQSISMKARLHEAEQLSEQLQAEIATLQDKLRHTIEDPVTHVLGRQIFEDRLAQSIKEGKRHQLSLGVLFIDIDDFKTINHALGKDMGDELLREVAKRIKTSIRQVDSVSRFSKDTFVVLLSQLSKPETAVIVVQRILRALNDVFQIQDREIYITACIGIVLFPNDGDDVVTLLERGNHALSLAKKNAKHTYQFYQPEMQVNSQRELTLHTGINRESIFQELSLCYQPIVDVQKNVMAGVEAKLQWTHPTLGLIDADEVFNLALKQHKLNEISEWMFRTACQQFLKWRVLGLGPAFLSVPVFIKQLENSHFIYRTSQLLQELAFDPDWLVFDIENNGEVASFDVLEKAFNMLSYLGIRVSINHVDSQALSLRYLKNFPIQYLKLEQSLIDDLEMNPKSLALMKAMRFLADSLSMQLIVQGVESKQQLEILKEAGFTLMEGGLLGPPMFANQFTEKMLTAV